MPYSHLILNASGCLVSSPGAAVQAMPPDQFGWLDIENASPEEEERLICALMPDVPDAGDLALCLEKRRFPAADIIASGIVLRLPLRNSREDELSTYLTLILFRNHVITLHEGELVSLGRMRALLSDQTRPHDEDWPRNAPDLAAFLLEGAMEDAVALFLSTRVEVEELADLQEDEPRKVPAAQILSLKHQVGHMAAQCEDQFYCFTVARSKLARAGAMQSLRGRMGELLQDTDHLQKSLHRIEARLYDMTRLAEGLLHTQTEQRIRTLTVISAIFMPLTLLTGIYGMNFADMPILQKAGAFDLLMLGMAGLAVLMLGFFAWRGWFR